MGVALVEKLSFDQANIQVESVDDGGQKNLFMRGVFIQGDVKNQNQRVYPINEINKAVKSLKEKINSGFSVLGEADHPEDLTVNLDRVSHVITEMDMHGADGIGKLKILPTPMGNLVKTLLESGVKLGVSSRGSGNVSEGGKVSDFEIVTVDIVAQPSAPDAYPDPIYEKLQYYKKGGSLMELAEAVRHDKKAQKHLTKGIVSFIDSLKI
ncbi:MAG: hypothetical protein CMQ75_03995 [Gammaproteobacteria bacterium]|nr:hypothetical protein [Gammaproteobacteria bacterium]